MGETLVFYGSVLLLVFFLSFLVGLLLYRLLAPKSRPSSFFATIFSYSFSGICVLILIYSIVRAGGASVSWLLVLPLVYFLIDYAVQGNSNKPGNYLVREYGLQSYLLAVLACLIPFLYFVVVLWKSGDFHWQGLNYDLVMYAKLSQSLAETGIENKWWMYLSDAASVQGVEPYHYFDCWLNAALCAGLNANPVLGLYLIVYPFFLSVALFGVLALLEHFKPLQWPEFLLSVLLLFLGPIMQLKGWYYGANRMAIELPWQTYGEKFAVYYPFCIGAMLLYLKGRLRWAFYLILGLCVVSITVLPALLALVGGILMFVKKDRLPLALLSALFFGTMWLFYLALHQGQEALPSVAAAYTGLGEESVSLSSLKRVAADVVLAFFVNLRDFSISYAWTLPLFLITYRRAILPKRLLLYTALFVLGGLLCSSVVYTHPDSHQFFSNTQVLLQALLITMVVGIVCTTRHQPLLLGGTLVLVIVVGLNNMTSALRAHRQEQASLTVADSYFDKVRGLVKNTPGNQQVGLFCGQDDYVRYFVGRQHNSFYHLSYLGLDPLPILMTSTELSTVPDTLLWARVYPYLRAQDAFFKFSEKVARDYHPEAVKEAFVRTQQVRYLILTPGYGYPIWLQKLVKDTCTDPRTGLVFAALHSP